MREQKKVEHYTRELWVNSGLTVVRRVGEIEMSVVDVAHVHHDAELLELAQYDLRIALVGDGRITRTSCGASFACKCVHGAWTHVTNQVVRVRPLQTLVT